LIDRTATVCEHCNKDVHPLGAHPSPDEGATSPTAEPGSAPEVEAAAPPLGDSSGQLIWWVTAILIYAILLFGVNVAFPFPSAGVAAALIVGELVAAYLLNRWIWRRMRAWPTEKVRSTVWIMVVVMIVLAAAGWARRRFLG
jgi:hypothetical protein